MALINSSLEYGGVDFVEAASPLLLAAAASTVGTVCTSRLIEIICFDVLEGCTSVSTFEIMPESLQHKQVPRLIQSSDGSDS